MSPTGKPVDTEGAKGIFMPTPQKPCIVCGTMMWGRGIGGGWVFARACSTCIKLPEKELVKIEKKARWYK